jgi:hypothetical protein
MEQIIIRIILGLFVGFLVWTTKRILWLTDMTRDNKKEIEFSNQNCKMHSEEYSRHRNEIKNILKDMNVNIKELNDNIWKLTGDVKVLSTKLNLKESVHENNSD